MDVATSGPLPTYLDSVTGGEVEGKPGIYKPAEPMPFSGWGQETGRTCIWKTLFGGHLCQPTKRVFTKGQKPIYLIRDGRDVMVSMWKLRNRIRDDEIEFLDWYYNFYPGIAKPYVFPQGIPIPGLWHWATQAWQRQAPDVPVVKYEELIKNKEACLDRLASYLGKAKASPETVEGRRVGIAPGEGDPVGRWMPLFDAEALEYWYACGEQAKRLLDNKEMQWK
jgi:hypothetical protein